MNSSQLIQSDMAMRNVQKPLKYLISGTSHALALQPEYFENSINISSYAESIQNTYFKLSHLVNEKEIRTENIILSYDLGFLSNVDIDNQPYQYYWNKYENRQELIKFSEDRISFLGNRISTFLFPYKDGEIDWFDFYFAKTTKGGENLRNSKAITKLAPIEKRNLDKECFDKKISDFGLYYFNNIINLCAKNNINLILIRFPVTEKFYFNASKCFKPDDYYKKVKSICFENFNFVKVYDFHNIYSEEYFRDPHHLKKGKIRDDFSEIVIDQLNKKQL